MALTKEQQEFKNEMEAFKLESNQSVKETKQLCKKGANLIKRFEKIDKIITDMAREKGLL